MINPLIIKDAEALYHEPQIKIKMFVDELIPQGLNLLCGASKIGKSWLMLWLCLQIANGNPIWDRDATQCDVLYLCLEDTYPRLQERLHKLTENPPENLRLSLMCGKIGDGLEEQINEYLIEYPATQFIVIDTLQKVRAAVPGNVNAYSHDYSELSKLKALADKHRICILLVHHVRKLSDSKDPVNEVSGSTGITGTVDTILVLKKDKRFSDDAVLYVSSRDVEQQELILHFEDARWELVECRGKEEIRKAEIPSFVFRVVNFMVGKNEWTGSHTELLLEMRETDLKPNVASKYLSQYCFEVLQAEGIEYSTNRSGRKGRTLTLKRCDDGVGSDDISLREKSPSSSSPIVTYEKRDIPERGCPTL